MEIAERDGAILSYLISLPDYLCTHFSTDLSQREIKSFLNERGFSKHVVLWSNLPAETREDLLVDFPKWYRTRHQHFFSLAEDNWLSRYLLARWFKNKYDKHKSKGAFSDFHPIKAFKQLTGGWSDSKSGEDTSPVDQSKSNGDLDVAGDGGATISPKAKVSVQSLIVL